jgi:hypothetical protein
MVTKGAAFGASMKLGPNTGGRTFRGPSNPNMVWDHFLNKKSFRFAGIPHAQMLEQLSCDLQLVDERVGTIETDLLERGCRMRAYKLSGQHI